MSLGYESTSRPVAGVRSSVQLGLRWRASGRCASQQATEQNASFTLPELQVDTVHL